MRSHSLGQAAALALLIACGETATSTSTATSPTPTSTSTSPSTPTPTATPTPTPPSTPTSTATASSTPTSTSPTPTLPAQPAPTPAPARRADALEPGGPAPLSRDGETVVDPGSSFEVELAGRIADARLVLLDGSDAFVAATSSREVGATTRLALAPAGPLVPGSRYLLRVEGSGAREMRGDDGVVHVPISFAILAAGTPPPPEPKSKPKRRRR